MPVKEKKEAGNEQLLEEILAKINKLKESERALEKKWSDSVLENKKQSVSKASTLEEEEKQRRVAILIESLKKTSKEKIILEEVEDDDLEEFDDLDFEPEEEEALKPVSSPEQENYELSFSEDTYISTEEELSKNETSTINLTIEDPEDSPLDSFEPALDATTSEINEAPLETESKNLDSEEALIYDELQQISPEPKEEIELKNESYDPEFEPKEDTIPQVQETEEQALEEVKEEHLEINNKDSLLLLAEPNPENYKKEDELLLEQNPYFKNKKILSKKKPILISILSMVLFIGVCVSIFAILKALR